MTGSRTHDETVFVFVQDWNEQKEAHNTYTSSYHSPDRRVSALPSLLNTAVSRQNICRENRGVHVQSERMKGNTGMNAKRHAPIHQAASSSVSAHPRTYVPVHFGFLPGVAELFFICNDKLPKLRDRSRREGRRSRHRVVLVRRAEQQEESAVDARGSQKGGHEKHTKCPRRLPLRRESPPHGGSCCRGKAKRETKLNDWRKRQDRESLEESRAFLVASRTRPPVCRGWLVVESAVVHDMRSREKKSPAPLQVLLLGAVTPVLSVFRHGGKMPRERQERKGV